jgi:cytochrome b6-f complex iron-sulfur subunit
MERRKFLYRFAAGATAMAAAPFILDSCMKDNTTPGYSSGSNASLPLKIDLTSSNYSSLQNAGGSVIVDNIIIVNENGSYIALSSICTHQGCSVMYSRSGDEFICPCHGSIFATSGSVLQGPAGTPLKKYTVKVSGNELTIS